MTPPARGRVYPIHPAPGPDGATPDTATPDTATPDTATPDTATPAGATPDELLRRVARGDENAFTVLYGQVSARVYGLVLRVVRDPAMAEEVAQEALVEVWRSAARFDPARGSAVSWLLTIAHRRAVDRVRSEQAASNRLRKAATADVAYDDVVEQATTRIERQQVRRCIDRLTELQREAVLLAYYRGCTYREVSELLDIPLPTIKTRMRDGLIRLRDCLGVTA